MLKCVGKVKISPIPFHDDYRYQWKCDACGLLFYSEEEIAPKHFCKPSNVLKHSRLRLSLFVKELKHQYEISKKNAKRK